MRVTGDRSDEIWVLRGDYAVAVHVRFFGLEGEPTDDGVAPDLAARAIAKLVRGTS